MNLNTLNPSGVDAVIVDLDGTMVDTMGDFNEALNRMLRDLSLPAIAADQVENMVGKGSEHLLRSVLKHVLVPVEQAQAAIKIEALFPQAWARYQHHYLEINGSHSAVYPGVVQGLQALQGAGLPLACLTNKPLSFAQPLLQAKGLDGFFARVFGGDSFERKKPDPLPLLKTCEALGVSPSHTVMVGDSSNDAQAATAAGCGILLVRYGYNHGHPIDEVPALTHVDRLDQAPWGALFTPVR